MSSSPVVYKGVVQFKVLSSAITSLKCSKNVTLHCRDSEHSLSVLVGVAVK
jgi:hypothetical protein